MQLINSNCSQKSSENVEILKTGGLSRPPAFPKRKSKLAKSGREIKNVDAVERSIVDLS